MDRRRLAGIALAVASAIGYGSGPLFAKGVYESGMDWLGLLAWRFLVGALLSWAWLMLFPVNRRALRTLSRRRLVALLGLGAFFIMNAATYYAALETVPASLAGLIVYVYPAVVAVLSIRFGRTLDGRRPWLALGIVTAGVALAIGGIPSGTIEPAGIALAVASPLIYSVYIILSARLAGERRGATAHDRSGGAGADTAPAVAAAVMLTATTAVTWLLASLRGDVPLAPSAVPPEAWPGLLGIAVFSTALAIQAFYAASARIGAAQTALVSTVEPVWTIVMATLLFGESLTPVQLIGGVLVIGGVVLAQTTPGEPLDEVREAVREEA
jgi:drug/metabolite transporter (DMT)-like permease